MAEKPKEIVWGPEVTRPEAETPEKVSLEEIMSVAHKQRDHLEAFGKGDLSIKHLEILLMEEIKKFVTRNIYHLNLVELFGERWRENWPEGEQRKCMIRLTSSDAINGIEWPL